MIDFYKYLNCSECSKTEFYCPEHRAEVEEILEKYDQDQSEL